MDSPLTPELALAYLRELSLDVRAAIVVGDDGRRLAGTAALEGTARALLAVPEAAGGLAVRTSGGWVFAERADAVGVVLAAGPLVLPGLMRHDVAEVVALLSGARSGRRVAAAAPPAPEALRGLAGAVEAVAAAAATAAWPDS